MNSLSKRIIGIDEDWDELLSLDIIREGDCEEGIVYVTNGEKWGVKDWQGTPIIPIQYDSVTLDEYEYACFHFVCKIGSKYDIFNFEDGKPKVLGITHYDVKKFFSSRYFICLANSYKRGGRCIAGIEMDYYYHNIQHQNNDNPRWVRPIADTLYGEIPNHIANNINLLSFVELDDGFACPDSVHSENVRYSRMKVIPATFTADSKLLNQFVDKVHQSIFGNRGKAISVDMASGLDYSLMFIHVHNANAYIDENREKSKNRMRFSYFGTEYDLPITDPAFLDKFRKEPESYANIPNVYLTLSLGLEFEGWHHKLVAGVIIPADSSQSKNEEVIPYMEQQKRLFTNAYSKWQPEDDKRLIELYKEGLSIQELARLFGRNVGAIRSRLSKLGVEIEESAHQNVQDSSNTTFIEQNNWFDEYEYELARLLDSKKVIEEQINALRERLLKQMKVHGVEKVHSRQFSVSYTSARTVMQFDCRTFREENEDLYSSYCKPKLREASIVVKRNKDD